MSDWGATKMAESQMHDGRHAKRLATLLTQLSEQPISSIPSAGHGGAETVAAYSVLDNPKVGVAEILSGHKQATLERIRAQAVALLVQETSFLTYGTLQPKVGRGTVKEKGREEEILPFPLQMIKVGREAAMKARYEGKVEEGVMAAGQISGLIRSIKPAGEIVRDVIAEAMAVLQDGLSSR